MSTYDEIREDVEDHPLPPEPPVPYLNLVDHEGWAMLTPENNATDAMFTQRYIQAAEPWDVREIR